MLLFGLVALETWENNRHGTVSLLEFWVQCGLMGMTLVEPNW